MSQDRDEVGLGRGGIGVPDTIFTYIPRLTQNNERRFWTTLGPGGASFTVSQRMSTGPHHCPVGTQGGHGRHLEPVNVGGPLLL